MEKVRQWLYYLIIGIISLIALCFLPMIGSTAGLGWNIPTTTVGWIVWVTVKIIVAILNVLIFHCFMLQAKLNIKDNIRYKEAQEILIEQTTKEQNPRSPIIWNKQQYGKKAVFIFCGTALGTIALTQAMLTFDYIAMLTYLFTIILGLICGILQMKSAEDYWTNEFWQYAQIVKKQMEMVAQELSEQGIDYSGNNCGTTILEPVDNINNSCPCAKSNILDS